MPTLQLLHCLSASVAGGATTIVDGFRVAEQLRHRDEAGSELVATQPVRCGYASPDAVLERERTILELDPRGETRAVNDSTRSMLPPAIGPRLVGPWYEAYCAFGDLPSDERFRVERPLRPGDLILVDNRCVRHGRTGFSASGERHLQGCYADRGLSSTLALLDRALPAAS